MSHNALSNNAVDTGKLLMVQSLHFFLLKLDLLTPIGTLNRLRKALQQLSSSMCSSDVEFE
jgi:hypothetical protein